MSAIELSFSDTGYFSKIAVDYMAQNEALRPFFLHGVSKEGIQNAINARLAFPQQREVLVSELQKQYDGIDLTDLEKENIAKLKSDNTFTITTAHQPNIFTGPLYMLYKILHVVKLAKYCKAEFPEYDFVPVYYMGSEDADLDEIGQFTVHGKNYKWDTKQTGAVGRMLVDKPLLSLLSELKNQINVEAFGSELTAIFEECYTLGKSIQQATLEIMHHLFGKYGLIVLIPDNSILKKLFEPVVKKELLTQFSHKLVRQTSAKMEANGYQQQASGRDLNLFYLTETRRERIEKHGDRYKVPALGLTFSEAEILSEVEQFPERFSGNVILRGAFQETVLPNIVFVGGGGELAYWLELKEVFTSVKVPYPMLLLRNSFALFSDRCTMFYKMLNIEPVLLFKSEVEILNFLSERKNGDLPNLSNDLTQLRQVYADIQSKAVLASCSLERHVIALMVQNENRIKALEKKMQREERRKLKTDSEWLQYLKTELFPNNGLQERVENIASLYGKYGSKMLDQILETSSAIPSHFIMLFLENPEG